MSESGSSSGRRRKPAGTARPGCPSGVPERLGTDRVGHRCLLPSSPMPRTTENWRISGASRPWGPFPRQKGSKSRSAGRREAPAPFLGKVSDNGALSVIYNLYSKQNRETGRPSGETGDTMHGGAAANPGAQGDRAAMARTTGPSNPSIGKKRKRREGSPGRPAPSLENSDNGAVVLHRGPRNPDGNPLLVSKFARACGVDHRTWA